MVMSASLHRKSINSLMYVADTLTPILSVVGVVRYIGRLETDTQGQLFIGVHLVMPGVQSAVWHTLSFISKSRYNI